jgi:Fe-S-cluster containining protein
VAARRGLAPARRPGRRPADLRLQDVDDRTDRARAVDDAAAGPLAAGDLAAWMGQVQDALDGRRDALVPCDGCTACCTSSQFVHIGPDETETLARIPADLLFPAPRMPAGHVLLGYDERGHCPLLVDGRCSIYEHRPRTCRTYDCRIFPAAGVTVEAPQVLVAERARRWRFAYAGDADRVRHEAVQAAAAFLRDHAGRLPNGTVPTTPTQRAVLAIQVHDVFLGVDAETGAPIVVGPDAAAVGEAVRRAGRRPKAS